MFRMLLRNVVTGEKHWYNDCYYNGKVKKNEVVLWKGPNDEKREKYKIIAWKWQGFDPRLTKADKEVDKFATESLLLLDLPQQWRDELISWQNRNA